MKTETIVMCVVALLLGMLLANMLKSVCGCKVVEGQGLDEGVCQAYRDTKPVLGGCFNTFDTDFCKTKTSARDCRAERTRCTWRVGGTQTQINKEYADLGYCPPSDSK